MPKPSLASLKQQAKRECWSQHIRNENDERAVLEGCRYFPEWGEHVCTFFSRFLRHSKGEWEGQPFVLADCQRDEIIMPAFSWARPDGNGGWIRRFNQITIFVAKKNFKSTMAAGLELYGLTADNEPGAEIYCVANARDQAGIVYREAMNMVKKSPELAKRLKLVPSTKTIMDRNSTASWMRALSADAASAEGLNAHMVVVDEIHKFDSRGRDLYDALIYSGAARRQPLFVVISTAGDDLSGVGYEVYEHAKSVLDCSRIDTSTFAYIAEPDKDDDPSKLETWRKANPMLGITVKEAELAQQWEKAKGSPRKESVFRRYRCNQWVGSDDPWLQMDAWNECAGDFGFDELAGKTCGAGLDLATKSDLTAFSLCFPRDDGVFAFLVHYFLPNGDIVAREKRDHCAYRAWAKEGWMTLTDGDTTDMNAIENYIAQCADRYSLCEIGFDPWNAHNIAQRLQDDHGLTMVEMRQGVYTLSGPSKRFEDLVKSRKLVHFNDPVLTHQAAIVRVKTDENGNIRPVKSLDNRKRWFRIDGIVASIMALARAGDEHGESVYEERGVRTF